MRRRTRKIATRYDILKRWDYRDDVIISMLNSSLRNWIYRRSQCPSCGDCE